MRLFKCLCGEESIVEDDIEGVICPICRKKMNEDGEQWFDYWNKKEEEEE